MKELLHDAHHIFDCLLGISQVTTGNHIYAHRITSYSSMQGFVLSNTTEKLATIFQMVWEKNLPQVVFKSKPQDKFIKKSYLISAPNSRFQHMFDGRNSVI